MARASQVRVLLALLAWLIDPGPFLMIGSSQARVVLALLAFWLEPCPFGPGAMEARGAVQTLWLGARRTGEFRCRGLGRPIGPVPRTMFWVG